MAHKTVRFVDSNGEIRHFDATGRDIHLDAVLSEILINFRPARAIADDLFPIVNVKHQSDAFYTWNQGDLWRVPDTIRAPLTKAKMVGFNVTSDNYFCRNFELGAGISIEDMANADSVLQLKEERSMQVRGLLALDQELRVANLVINSSNVSTVSAPLSGAWGIHDDSDPIYDIDTAAEQMRQQTGYMPTDLVLGPTAWRHLKRNANVRQILFPQPGGTRAPGTIVPAAAAGVFELERVHIAGMVRNTAAEGFDKTLVDIWGPHALLYYRPDRPSRTEPSYAYTFRWKPAGSPGIAAVEYFDQSIKGTIIEVGMYVDERIISSDLATLIASVV